VPASADPQARQIALGRGYVTFAQSHSGLLKLMLRSERLDWTTPALSQAAASAFALLTPEQPQEETAAGGSAFHSLVQAIERLALVHGLATLLVDGRVQAMAAKSGEANVQAVVDAVLGRMKS
jgi:hypothetical protein